MTTPNRDLDITPPPPSWPCADCDFRDPDVEVVFAHLMSAHNNRRRVDLDTGFGRRKGDRTSPWVTRNLRAAAAGEGLSRPRLS